MVLQCVALTVALVTMDHGVMDWCNTLSAGLVDQVRLGRNLLLWTMVAVTLWSGWDYVLRAIQILRKHG